MSRSWMTDYLWEQRLENQKLLNKERRDIFYVTYKLHTLLHSTPEHQEQAELKKMTQREERKHNIVTAILIGACVSYFGYHLFRWAL